MKVQDPVAFIIALLQYSSSVYEQLGDAYVYVQGCEVVLNSCSKCDKRQDSGESSSRGSAVQYYVYSDLLLLCSMCTQSNKCGRLGEETAAMLNC